MKLKARFFFASAFILVVFFMSLRWKRRRNVDVASEIKSSDNKVDAGLQQPADVSHLVIDSPKQNDEFIKNELDRLYIDLKSVSKNFVKWPWKIAADWVNNRQIYPEYHPELAQIMYAMANAKITKADVLPKGTQLKLKLTLEGDQTVVFKQKRYERNFVIEGKPYDGFDRHNGEIASFHLDRVFNFRRSPITVGRVLNLREEVLPVATEKLKKTFLEENGNLCYFGVCYYCKEEEKACADGDIMEGAITLWLPQAFSDFVKQRHPYQRTYIEKRQARWEYDDTYCDEVVKHKAPYDRGTRLLDVTDASVFDYLIGNADRHHYEVFKDKGDDAMLIMLDNAKSFGNPYWHEPSILAPIRQCCILRNSTWNKILQFRNGVLRQLLEGAMSSDPISPILHHTHLNAITERLPHIISAVQHCIDTRGRQNVLLNEWKGVNSKT